MLVIKSVFCTVYSIFIKSLKIHHYLRSSKFIISEDKIDENILTRCGEKALESSTILNTIIHKNKSKMTLNIEVEKFPNKIERLNQRMTAADGKKSALR